MPSTKPVTRLLGAKERSVFVPVVRPNGRRPVGTHRLCNRQTTGQKTQAKTQNRINYIHHGEKTCNRDRDRHRSDGTKSKSSRMLLEGAAMIGEGTRSKKSIHGS